MPSKKFLFIGEYPEVFKEKEWVGGSVRVVYNMIVNSKINFDIISGVYSRNSKKNTNKKISRYKFLIPNNNPKLSQSILSKIFLVFLVTFRLLISRPNIIVLNLEVFSNSLIILISKFFFIPVICLSHGEEISMALKKSSFWGIKNKLLKLTYPMAKGHIVMCHFVRELLIKEVSVDKKLIDVIPSNIDINQLPKKILNKPDNKENAFKLLSVGRIQKRKGFQHCISAVNLLRRKFENIHLDIVGDGSYKEQIRELINSNNLEKKITLHGRVDKNKLNNLYQDCDLFILANYQLENGDTEGCPTVFAEASGFNLPIIGGTGGGAETIIDNYKNGIIVNTSNISELVSAIDYILSDKDVAITMGKLGREKVERDHNSINAGKMFNLSINRLLEGKSASKNQNGINSKFD